ncbi:MAG TPA: hypothetical protein VF174_14535 [Micromonosporaceae bacterium]
MNVTTIRQGLAARIATVVSVASDGLAPAQVMPAPGKPVAVVVPDPGTFIIRDTQGPGGYMLNFNIKLLVATQLTAAAQKVLDTYLDTTSDKSVVAAVEDPSLDLGGGGEFATVAAVRGYGSTEYGGVIYPVSAELVIGVAAI